jgi:hypothetical protein
VAAAERAPPIEEWLNISPITNICVWKNDIDRAHVHCVVLTTCYDTCDNGCEEKYTYELSFVHEGSKVEENDVISSLLVPV